MASAYKWRITNTKYAYLATPTSDVPVISGFTADEEVKIAQRVNGYSETTYSTQYNILKGIIAADPDGAKLTMLSYKYYYDIDETSCGFTNESIGPQGIQGLQGIQGIQGLQGNDGIGIDYIYTGTTANVASGFRVYIRLTNGVEYYFDVVNGQDGLPASIDYDRIVSAITALNIGEQISGATAEYLIEQLNRIYGREIVNIREILQAYSGIMSTLSADTGSVQAQVLYESGITRQLWEYYNTQYSSITQIYQEFNAYSGLVGQMVVYVDLVSSAVTDLESGYLAVSGMLYDYITRTDALTGDMSGLTMSYNALSNSFSQTIFNITQGGDSGNTYVELSQIYQSANCISAVTSNGNLSAGIMMAINGGFDGDESNDYLWVRSDGAITHDYEFDEMPRASVVYENKYVLYTGTDTDYFSSGMTYTSVSKSLIRIEASNIKFIGNTIEMGSESGIHSCFYADGSGYLCGNKIHWNEQGTFTIEDKAIINDCRITECNISACTIQDAVINGRFIQPWSKNTQAIWWGGDEYARTTNVSVPTNGSSGTDLSKTLMWDVTDDGRLVRVTNFDNEGGTMAEGELSLTVPANKDMYFFEDGIRKKEIILSREGVELLGYGSPHNSHGGVRDFYGYIVLNRFDVYTVGRYGRQAKTLCEGVLNYREDDMKYIYVCFDGGELTFERESEGLYIVKYPNDWQGSSIIRVAFPMVCGLGYIKNSTEVPCHATVIQSNGSQFKVAVSNGSELKDGSFLFRLTNMYDLGYSYIKRRGY